MPICTLWAHLSRPYKAAAFWQSTLKHIVPVSKANRGFLLIHTTWTGVTECVCEWGGEAGKGGERVCACVSLCICYVQALWHFCCQAKSSTPLVIIQLSTEAETSVKRRANKTYFTYTPFFITAILSSVPHWGIVIAVVARTVMSVTSFIWLLSVHLRHHTMLFIRLHKAMTVMSFMLAILSYF